MFSNDVQKFKFSIRYVCSLLFFVLMLLIFGFLRTKWVGTDFEFIAKEIVFSVLVFTAFVIGIKNSYKNKFIIILGLSLAVVLSVELFAVAQEKYVENHNTIPCNRMESNIQRWWPFWFNEIACGKNGEWVGND